MKRFFLVLFIAVTVVPSFSYAQVNRKKELHSLMLPAGQKIFLILLCSIWFKNKPFGISGILLIRSATFQRKK